MGVNAMKVAKIEPMIVNIPNAGEGERPVGRNGMTAVLVRVETDTGLVGWGEGSVGANAESVYEAMKATIPMVLGRNPWNTQAIADDVFNVGEWNSAWRPGGANYAYSGIDMALWTSAARIAASRCTICSGACADPGQTTTGS